MPRTGRPRDFDEDEVVDAAKELFWTRGYAATSVRDLVDRLDVRPSSLYGTFGDKRGLYLMALRRYVAEVNAGLARLDTAAPVLPELRALLQAALQRPAGGPARGCLLGNTAVELASVDADAADVVRDGLARTEEAFRLAIERAYVTGELPRRNAAAQARMLVALVQGLQVVSRADPDPERLNDAVDAGLAALT
jgi:TetR/AcrR family transcriptional repressor of nem operon